MKGLYRVFSSNKGLNAQEIPSGSVFPNFVPKHLYEAQRYKCTKTFLRISLRSFHHMRELKKFRQCMEFLQWEGPDRWDASDSDKSCKTTELKSLCEQNDSSLTLDLPKGSAKAEKCWDPSQVPWDWLLWTWVFDFLLQLALYTQNFHLPPWESKQNTAVWGREFPPQEWWDDPGGLCHASETSCSWLKPLWWFYSAPPTLVGIIADPQEVGEKPTQVGFVCTALLFELWLGILLCHRLSQWCPFCCPWEYCLLLCFSSYIWALSSIWMSMAFNLWVLQYILLCIFESSRDQALYSHM